MVILIGIGVITAFLTGIVFKFFEGPYTYRSWWEVTFWSCLVGLGTGVLVYGIL